MRTKLMHALNALVMAAMMLVTSCKDDPAPKPKVEKGIGEITINDTTKSLTGVAKATMDPALPEIFMFSCTYSQATVEDGSMMEDLGDKSRWSGYLSATNMTNVDLTQTPDPDDMFMLALIGEGDMYEIYYNIEGVVFKAYYVNVSDDSTYEELTIKSGTISYNQIGDKITLNLDMKLSSVSGEHSIKFICDGDVPDVVAPFYVEEIKLDKESLELKAGESGKVSITEILPENAENKNVVWSSDNNDVARVDQEGNITALKAGYATIVAEADDGGDAKAKCVVTVTEGDDTGDKEYVTITFKANGGEGEMAQQMVEREVLTPINSNTFTRTNYTFSEWNNLADGSGVIKYADGASVNFGPESSSAITFYAQWSIDEALVAGYWEASAVSGKYNDLPLSLDVLKLIGIDPMAFLFNADGTGTSPFSTSSATWGTSGDELTITAAGIGATLNIDAISASEMTLSCSALTLGTLGSATDVEMTLKRATQPDPTVAVESVTLNKSTLSLAEGKSETLIATINPSGATNKNISWKSNDTTVATVTQAGEVTAVKAGSATITVTSEDGSKTATCVVTVVTPTGTTPPDISSGGEL